MVSVLKAGLRHLKTPALVVVDVDRLRIILDGASFVGRHEHERRTRRLHVEGGRPLVTLSDAASICFVSSEKA